MNYQESIDYLRNLDLPVLSAVVDIAKELVANENTIKSNTRELKQVDYGQDYDKDKFHPIDSSYAHHDDFPY